MKKEVYVCVDKDGTEKITNSVPIRRHFKGSRILSAMFGLCTGAYTKNNWNKWCDGWSTDQTDFLPFSGVVLPNGTIEKILGKKLTWNDEAVKI